MPSSGPPRQASDYETARIQAALDEITAGLSGRVERGAAASYIAPLAAVDTGQFGISVAMADGRIFVAGDADQPFSIQSISKVFTLTLALGMMGNALWRRVGREPSGDAFNSIVLLEHERGIPRNPFINAGSLVVADALLSQARAPRETIAEIVRFLRFVASDDLITVDPVVAAAEQDSAFRNAALANYLKSFGNLNNPPDHVLGVYVHHCAVAMSCRQLAKAGLFLASGGRNPETGRTVVSEERARRINALMMTCGHYDGSGDFAFRVGLPSKSGVGGGILTTVPGIASIAVWSPGLNAQGNSLLGIEALEALSRQMRWSVF